MVPMLQDLGVGMIPYTSLAGGFLTRRVDEANTVRSNVDGISKFLNGDPKETKFLAEINERIAGIAERKGVSMGQIAVAWLLSKPFITAPVIGSTSIEKLKDLIGGLDVKLSEEEVKSIDEPYLPRAVVSHT
ncbi:hypothetical protein FRB90_009394 [Tulasnella sp. 427]|nr:hypothetical protein FRB90_009394 [Tulasnella sp. 427]